VALLQGMSDSATAITLEQVLLVIAGTKGFENLAPSWHPAKGCVDSRGRELAH